MIRIADIINTSVVDGTGIRLVLFLQGCTRNCPDCHNPQQQPLTGGQEITEEELAGQVLERLNPLHRGITISGGEPLLQAGALFRVLSLIKEQRPDLDFWMYTGYTFDEVHNLPVLELIDVLVDGPFIQAERDLDLPFRGSSNQRLIDVRVSLRASRVVELNLVEEREITKAGVQG